MFLRNFPPYKINNRMQAAEMARWRVANGVLGHERSEDGVSASRVLFVERLFCRLIRTMSAGEAFRLNFLLAKIRAMSLVLSRPPP